MKMTTAIFDLDGTLLNTLGNVNGFHEMFTFQGVVAYEARGISPARRARRTHGEGQEGRHQWFLPS